jgi:O-antigen/teichoic acid export membrane protein
MAIPGLNNKHFLVLMGNAFTVIIGFATSFLLFHFLPVREVGMWFVILSLVTLCEAMRYGFLATATVAFYAGTSPERAKTVLGSVWFLALILSGIILSVNGIAFLFLPYIHNAQAILCIKWVGITYLSTVTIDVVSWRLQAEEKYDKIFRYRLINSLLTISSFSILIALGKMTLENALLCNLLANSAVSIVGLWASSGIKHIFHRTRACTMEVLHYGKYMLGTTSFTALLANADTWIINFMLGPAAVAVYNLATRFIAIIELPLRSLLTTGMSEMSISYNRNDIPHLTYIFKKYSGMLTLALVPVIVGLIIIADIPINLLGGEKYSHTIAANSFRLFLLVSLCYPIDRFNGLALDVMRQTRTNFYKVILMLAIKVVANFAGIAIFGSIFGINLSYYVVAICAIIFGNYQLRKHINYTIPDIFITGHRELKALIQNKLPIYSSKKVENKL